MYEDVDPDLLHQCIESTIGPGTLDGPETDYNCPFCQKAGYDKIGHLHVHYRKNMAICHSCMWKTRDLAHLVRALLGKIPRSISRLTSDQDVEDVVMAILFGGAGDQVAVSDAPVFLPEGFVPMTGRPNDRLGRVVLDYLEDRGVPFERLVEIGAGYCNDGLLRGYAVFPVYVRGELVTYTSRRVTGMGPKVRHAFSSGASSALFNYDNCADASRVFVGEGPFDAWAFHKRLEAGDGGVATLGTMVSDAQAYLLSSLPCKEVVVCYDADAHDKARKAAAKISKYSGKVVSVVFPDKDPDEFTPDALEKLVEGRSVCDPEADEIRSILQE